MIRVFVIIENPIILCISPEFKQIFIRNLRIIIDKYKSIDQNKVNPTHTQSNVIHESIRISILRIFMYLWEI